MHNTGEEDVIMIDTDGGGGAGREEKHKKGWEQ
jgi:hypothetical protein